MAENNNPEQAKDTGHEWDGIRELTNPIPRWWMISFHISWIWCIVYFILYPSIPLVNGSNEGLLGWTQIKEFKQAVAENEAVKAPYMEKLVYERRGYSGGCGDAQLCRIGGQSRIR